MRLQTEKCSLPTPLTAEELAEESKLLAEADLAVNRQEALMADALATWKDRKRRLEDCLGYLKTQAADQLEIVHSQTKEKEVECSWLYALKHGYAFLVRDDTGELVHHRKLGDQERQTELLEVLREPTEEQLATWISDLGLVVDQQRDLPLTAEGDGPVFYYRTITIPDARERGIEQIIGRFTEADHRPSSLTGIHVRHGDSTVTGLPEQIDRGSLSYVEDPEIIHEYRLAMEDLLEAKKAEAHKSRGEFDESPAPTPSGRGRKK